MSFLFWNEVCPGGQVKQPAAVKFASQVLKGKLHQTNKVYVRT